MKKKEEPQTTQHKHFESVGSRPGMTVEIDE